MSQLNSKTRVAQIDDLGELIADQGADVLWDMFSEDTNAIVALRDPDLDRVTLRRVEP